MPSLCLCRVGLTGTGDRDLRSSIVYEAITEAHTAIIFSARQHMLSALYAIARLSVRLSDSDGYTSIIENGRSYDYEIFTVR